MLGFDAQVNVLLETSDLLEVVVITKVVWRFVVRECGVQSVMTFGAMLMPMLCVASLDIPTKVLLQGVGPSLGKAVAVFCLITWAALEPRPDSLTAPIMALVSTTVFTLKMLELPVKLLQPHHLVLTGI